MQVTREQLQAGSPVGVGFSAVVQLVEGVVYCYHPRDKLIWWRNQFDPSIPRWNAGTWGWRPIIPPRNPGAAALWEKGFNSKNRGASGAAVNSLVATAERRAQYWDHRPAARTRRYGGLALHTVILHTGRLSVASWEWAGEGKFPDLATVERCLAAPFEIFSPQQQRDENFVVVEPDDDEVAAEIFRRQDGGGVYVKVDRDVAIDHSLHRVADWRRGEGDTFTCAVRDADGTNIQAGRPKSAWVRIVDGRIVSARVTRGYEHYL